MKRPAILLILLLSLVLARPAIAEGYVVVAFHDVLDDPAALGSDDIATPRLVAFLDWVRGNGWTTISLNDIEAARRHQRPLPPKSILLTFDDGYHSHYSRVFPLLLAYRMHAIFGLVGAWMAPAPGTMVRYGNLDVPRDRFMSWQQAREMAASGFAEFASHSYDMHHGVPGNAQGSEFSAATAWMFNARDERWESDAAVRARVRADLERSRRLIRDQLGVAPRALIWPYGRFAGPARDGAHDAGFSFMFTLAEEPADTAIIDAIPRLFPAQGPTLAAIVEGLRYANPTPVSRRVACLDPATIADQKSLGAAIEAVRQLGVTTVVLGTNADRGALSFIAWQLRSRAGVKLFLRLDPRTDSDAAMMDAVRSSPIDGVLIEAPGNLADASPTPVGPSSWTVRAARDAIDLATLDADGRRAMRLFRAATALRPDLLLALPMASDLVGGWPPQAADWLLVAPPAEGLQSLASRLAKRGWLVPEIGQRLSLPVPAGDARAAARAIRAAQVQGATGFGLCPALLPADPALRAAFSASSFPRLP